MPLGKKIFGSGKIKDLSCILRHDLGLLLK